MLPAASTGHHGPTAAAIPARATPEAPAAIGKQHNQPSADTNASPNAPEAVVFVISVPPTFLGTAARSIAATIASTGGQPRSPSGGRSMPHKAAPPPGYS